MNNISSRINIYTDAAVESISSAFQKIQGRISAWPVFKDGKIVSQGKERERFNFLGSDPIYHLAIQTLSQEKQQKVREQGHAGWFKSFFWKPLTLKTSSGEEVTVLVNINSAIKRLNLLGLSANEVKEALDKGNLVTLAQEKQNQIMRAREISAQEYKARLNCSMDDAYLVHDYVKAFHTTPENAFSAVTQMNQRLTFSEIEKVVNFVKHRKTEWEHIAAKTNAPVRVRAKDFPGELPRTIQYNPDGTIYILFNKVKSERDTLLGKGTYKTAKLALDLLKAEMVARVTQEDTEMARSELETSIRLSHQEGIAHTYAVTMSTYKTTHGNATERKLGFMQKLYTGGDLWATVDPTSPRHNKHNYPAATEKEKFVVAKRVLSALDWLHHKKDMIHRDLKPANLFLIRDPVTREITDCVLADFGMTCKMRDSNEREVSQGTLFYESPELLIAKSDKEIRAANAFPNDNWAAGVILYQLFKEDVPEWNRLSKEPPWFKVADEADLVSRMKVLTNDWLPIPTDPQSIGHIIRGLLNRDPKQRMDTTEALAKVQALIAAKQLKV